MASKCLWAFTRGDHTWATRPAVVSEVLHINLYQPGTFNERRKTHTGWHGGCGDGAKA